MTDPALQFLLKNLVAADGVPEMEIVLAGTLDGLLKAVVSRDSYAADAAASDEAAAERRATFERLAAVSSTMAQVAAACLEEQGDEIRQLVIEGSRCWYVVVVAGAFTFLATRVEHDADLNQVFFHLHGMVNRIRKELDTQARQHDGLSWAAPGTARES